MKSSNVFVVGDFDETMETKLIPELTGEIQRQAQFKEGRVDLYINSYGGYTHYAFHLVSLAEIAKSHGVVVRTIVPDTAFSCGSILAIAGTPGERYIEKTAEHLIHYGEQFSGEKTLQQIERNTANKIRHFKKIANHYRKYADVPNLEELMSDDSLFIPARDCITWGLADKYLTRFDVGAYEPIEE